MGWVIAIGTVLFVVAMARAAYIATHPAVRLRLDAQLEYERSRRKGWDDPPSTDAPSRP